MSYSSEVLADSPLLYWKLDETSGTTAADSSGNGRNGTHTAGPTVGQPSLLASGAGFSAAYGGDINGSGYTTLADAAWMDVTQFTAEAIIRPSIVSGLRPIATRWTGGNTAFLFSVNAGKLHLQINGGGAGKTVTGATTLTVGTTYTAAATYDGSNLRLWLNGAVDGTQAFAGSLSAVAVPFVVATAENVKTTVGEFRFGGQLDEVAYYGSALSSGRIAAHHAAAVDGGAGTPISGSLSAVLPW